MAHQGVLCLVSRLPVRGLHALRHKGGQSTHSGAGCGTVHTQVQGWAQYTLGRRGRHRKHSGAGVGTVHTQAQVWAQ